MPPWSVNGPRRREILLLLCVEVVFVARMHCEDAAVSHLSTEDRLLLKDEPDPKCFSRSEYDLTCFFERQDNGTYDFFYSFGNEEKRCELSRQHTDDGAFLHICSFPVEDVPIFVEIHLKVMERHANHSLHARTIFVEEQFLLDPPVEVSLHQSEQAGQLRVSWDLKASEYWASQSQYRIRYSSLGLEKTKEGKEGKDDKMVSVVPGSEVEVRVSIKCSTEINRGHWSHWSQPARAVASQSADDVALRCFTSDLQRVTCQWDGSRYGANHDYKLLYTMHHSEALGWSKWTECLVDRRPTGLCSFQGNKSRKVRVKLSGGPPPLGRTFYTQEFTLNTSVRTRPPAKLKGELQEDRLCLKWEAPLRRLLSHLQYEVSYLIKEREEWMVVSCKGPATSTCLDVPRGTQYRVKIRAKPQGPFYSGDWSDWSDVLSGDTPTNIGQALILMICIPATILVITIILLSFLSKYSSKLKQHFWPPVPNLDKVLQGFLTEINGQKWDPPAAAKQCFEEAASSVVEVMSREEVSGLGKPPEESTQLLSPDQAPQSGEPANKSQGTEVKVFPDYVTLNRDSVIVCPKGNKYEQVGEARAPKVEGELLQRASEGPCTEGSPLETDLLNPSYLPLAESVDKPSKRGEVGGGRGPGNIYTNLPCS